MKRFDGKIALVTGAARGIGAATAKLLQAEGASVLGLDIAPVQHCDAHLNLDLSKPEKISAELDALAKEGVEIDILIHAAALCPTHPLQDTSIDLWRKVLDVNLIAAAELVKCVSKGMTARKLGTIVNVVSVSAFLPKPDQLEYGASKAALTSLTYSLAASLGPYGIRVNGVAPGIIDTPLTKEIAEARARKGGSSADPLESVPLKRMGTAEEVAKAICFLASDDASYINGQILGVDGGLSDEVTMAANGLWHLSFTVSDLDRSVSFYRDLLGLVLVHRQTQQNEYTSRLVGFNDVHLDVAMLTIPGAETGRFWASP